MAIEKMIKILYQKKRETFFEQLEEEDYVQKPIILCFDLSGI